MNVALTNHYPVALQKQSQDEVKGEDINKFLDLDIGLYPPSNYEILDAIILPF